MDEKTRLAALADIDAVSARLQAALDFANGVKPKSPGQLIADAIIGSIRPNYRLGAEYQGNWPAWATCAIEVERFHRSFGNRSSGKDTIYFADICEIDQWVSDEQSHIANIDYAYSVSGQKWVWDLGPNHVGGFSLG